MSDEDIHERRVGYRKLTGQLRCRSTHQSHETCRVDDASTSMEPLGLVCGVLPHSEDSVLATPPHTLQVDVHSQVPDALLGVQRVIVGRVHDS